MARTVPHVALLIETSRSYGRGLLRGIRRFVTDHERWSVYMELRALDSRTPKWLKQWKGDGILVRTGDRQMADAVTAADIPTVELRSSRMMDGFPFVGCDNSTVSKMVAEHFLERGFRNFAVYGIDTEEYFEERWHNFVAAVKDAGFETHNYAQSSHRERPNDWEKQQDSIANWVSGLPKPVGILACTDQLGFWLLEACGRAGVSVPEEVSVVGCENDESLVNLSTPPMSSVQFNADRIGFEAASLLHRMLQGEKPPEEPTLIPPLGVITRQSSDIIAVDDEWIGEALKYIREHAQYGINVNDVLRAVPISRRALDQKMRQYIGRTTKSEIVRVQLDRVKQLLADTDLSLSQIADRTGFRHPQYMAGLFKKKCGITPGTYRAGFHEQR